MVLDLLLVGLLVGLLLGPPLGLLPRADATAADPAGEWCNEELQSAVFIPWLPAGWR
ncbi:MULTISPECIES: hypothetical protein [unclassified Undibacterium]|uniref:hypothetical protein n=1 Tax=unclassified Undibacterium TaxID=2630295 RepID=UPI002AC89A0E|nr:MULTISPECIES: hypothetical protein [unclassified Undibacterium]MEB0139832.1 hypothetical protein [Undibacterium sp. CCC2.1]MEB0172762.1 hypothetical protein [Undibacterium sp. CCC1.1]MEB0176554.1 hypothetical protein [Undibacterium sp. CCC3.4]MEB0215856.1 hypothetical protein [Undibacterium sp. 5I2]WPX42707.1 hypothetical protein RHM61_15120 [Undibacterium sp. CCC3.4]